MFSYENAKKVLIELSRKGMIDTRDAAIHYELLYYLKDWEQSK